jgi:hypothetical protein
MLAVKRTALAVLAAIALTVAVTTSLSHPIPPCQEDEVLVGQGGFTHSGYWDNYRCTNVEEVR